MYIGVPRMINRREFLVCSAAAAASLMAPAVFARPAKQLLGDRQLRFYNLHTGEKLSATYWADGRYQADELAAINQLLRDHRNGEVAHIDQQLLDQLYLLQHDLSKNQFYEIISGYRSPATNVKLQKHTNGVAKRSLHMQGKAIDVRLRGVDIKHLRQAAMKLRAGGVGYYPESNFVHLDSGRPRFW